MKRQHWIIAALTALTGLALLAGIGDNRTMYRLSRFLHTHAAAVFALGLAVCVASLLLNRRGNAALLALYLLFIAYMTLMYRDAVVNRLNLELFWSYRQFLSAPGMRMEILFNILLFIPLGLILYRLTGRPWAALIAVAVSVAVELTQYALGIGLCELDDIVSNGLGGGLGCLLGIAAGRLRDLRRTKEE